MPREDRRFLAARETDKPYFNVWAPRAGYTLQSFAAAATGRPQKDFRCYPWRGVACLNARCMEKPAGLSVQHRPQFVLEFGKALLRHRRNEQIRNAFEFLVELLFHLGLELIVEHIAF